MSQLIFHYGAMASGKSIEILKVAYNYQLGGRQVMLITPAIANRDGDGVVASRIGLKQEAHTVQSLAELKKLLEAETDAVLIDEAQFLTPEMVDYLGLYTDVTRIPVLAFGLKTDAFTNLFEGSKRLLEVADKLVELKTLCRFCTKKATMNLRTENGLPVYDGDVVQIGDSEYYPVCRNHYYNPIIDGAGQVVFYHLPNLDADEKTELALGAQEERIDNAN